MTLRVTILFAALVGVCISLVGCSAGPGNFQPVSTKAGQATIYVYMKSTLLWNQMKGTGEISIDGKSIGNVGSGLHYIGYAAPGKRKIRYHDIFNPGHLLTGGNTLNLNVKAGQTYFVRLRIEMYHATAGTLIPELVPSALGKAEIRRTRRG